MTHRALIVGCGDIAGGLDDLYVDTTRPSFTHAKAYRKDKNFRTIGCVDPNPKALDSFQKRWSIPNGFFDIDDALCQGLDVDVISICSPTKHHGKHLNQVLSLNPKLVFCEKPIHENYLVAKDIVQKYKAQNVHLIINYSRRFDAQLALFKESLISKDYGELHSISGWYNKGLLNNGSHLLDILNYLFETISVKYVGSALFDFTLEDPSVPVVLSTGSDVNISLSCGDARDYSLFELDFVFSNARVKMFDGGLKWSVEKVIDSDIFIGYKTLGPLTVYEGGYPFSFQNALINIHECLSSNVYPLCNGDDGLAVLELYSQIMSQI